MKFLRLMVLVLLLMAAMCACACAQVVWHDFQTDAEVFSVEIHGEDWLFLPSFADLSKLQLNGETLDWLAVSQPSQSIPGAHDGHLSDGTPLHVMKSENLRSVHLYSHDPANQNRQWLEQSPDHSRLTFVRFALIGKDGHLDCFNGETEIRGRGNTTWQGSIKKPYQIRLNRAEDLLQTGLWQEAARTWVLLANECDNTMLLNQLALDIGKELGLPTTSRCEQVDLYYDGDYRGTYLLCEKVEAATHSADIYDLDGALSKINRRLGFWAPVIDEGITLRDGESPVPDGQNTYGLHYAYADGVYDYRQVLDGGYLLELEGPLSLNTHTWFQLSSGQYVGVKSPRYAGDSMMRFISERFEDAYQALTNFGFHPETGEPLENFFDVDSLVRSLLTHELLPNIDGYRWASTYFVLPEGETRFYAGPLWDFDRLYEEYPALKDDNDFSYAFQRTTVTQEAAKAICRTQLSPMLENILFGSGSGQFLKPLSVYREELRTSWMMNYFRHYALTRTTAGMNDAFDSVMKTLERMLMEQSAFVLSEVEAWGGDAPTHEASLRLELPYGDVTCTDRIVLEDETHGSLYLKSADLSCVEEATEDSFALWQADLVIAAKPGCRIEDDLEITLNGDPVEGERTETEVRISCTFEDPSYRPAVWDGVDYGYVFNYDYYWENNPDAGDDFETVLRTFVEEGMDNGEMGNEFFDPIQLLDFYTHLTDEFGGDWRLYYEAFMESPKDWMLTMDNTYEPEWEECAP